MSEPGQVPEWTMPPRPPATWTFEMDSRATSMSVVRTSERIAPVFATPDAIASYTALFRRSANVPPDVSSLLDLARKLLQAAPIHYEFAAVGVEKSLQALELGVRTRLGAGSRPTFDRLLKTLAAQGLLPPTEIDRINMGRELRNRVFAHPTTAVALPLVVAMELTGTSHELIAGLFPDED